MFIAETTCRRRLYLSEARTARRVCRRWLAGWLGWQALCEWGFNSLPPFSASWCVYVRCRVSLFWGSAAAARQTQPRTFGIVAKFDHGNTTSPVAESPSDSDS